MSKILSILFLTFCCFASKAQDSTIINFQIHSTPFDSVVEGKRVVLMHNDSIIKDTTTDQLGKVRLKFASNLFKDGTLFSLGLPQHEKDFQPLQLAWKYNYEFFLEVSPWGCQGTYHFPIDDFRFEKNEHQIKDSSAERSFRFLADYLNENPRLLLQATALYNYDESEQIAEKRLAYFQEQLEKYGINSDHFIFRVMKPDYEQDYKDYEKEVYLNLTRENFQKATSEEKKWFALKYQRIKLSALSWEYDYGK